jgi:tRNA-specific 2-thiouridylase
MANHQKHVIAAMSGGVDSSVAALLLKQQGYRVTGVFMQNWEADNDDPFCSAQQDLIDARSVCDRLNITLRTVNFAAEYWSKVFQYFLDEHAAGRTPNPDVLCNQEIKFKVFLDYALSGDADYIATGHYIRSICEHKNYYLLKGLDCNKDQSYFLYTLGQDQLRYSLFPVGHLEKHHVRTIAAQAKLLNHAKKDSTGICFIGERKFSTFLSEYLLAQPGHIETDQGETIGQHKGLMFYTIGQRQGLGIGGHRNYKGSPWYVLAKELPRNTLIVGQGHNHPLLMKNKLICQNVHWINQTTLPLACQSKIRYRQSDQACLVTRLNDNDHLVEFSKPQRAITPGQSIVFYQQNTCLGGGIIAN